MQKLKCIFFICCFFYSIFCRAENTPEKIELHHINFSDLPVSEFIRFVSKISKANFIFDHRDVEFNVTLSSGKPISSEEVVKALIQILRVHGFAVSEEGNYYVVHKLTKEELEKGRQNPALNLPLEKLIAGDIPVSSKIEMIFSTYKLKYHQGNEIEMALKRIAADLSHRRDKPTLLLEAIQTIQWVKATNSLFYSGDEKTCGSLQKLVSSLDIPRRQVFIEVLVVETDTKKTLEFGLQWVGGGKFRDKVGFGTGNFPAKGSSFGKTVQGINPANTPTGLDQIPIGRGFDLGVIGDIILHKGKTFLTLGSLVSALQADGDTNIVLNQKIITQDNKNSKIFVGDNIPFTGSIVQTVGQGQQTTANIEYRDVGVNLSITPMLGEEDVITLDIDQEITEAIEDPQISSTEVEGIRTTKTNMATHVHVPNNHFLVLSGMIRNAKSYHKAGLPCLGGLPLIGAAFSQTRQMTQKRNVIIFVRPHIINSFEDYMHLTKDQDGFSNIIKENCTDLKE